MAEEQKIKAGQRGKYWRFVTKGGGSAIVNMDQVRYIEHIDEESANLVFDTDHKLEVTISEDKIFKEFDTNPPRD